MNSDSPIGDQLRDGLRVGNAKHVEGFFGGHGRHQLSQQPEQLGPAPAVWGGCVEEKRRGLTVMITLTKEWECVYIYI